MAVATLGFKLPPPPARIISSGGLISPRYRFLPPLQQRTRRRRPLALGAEYSLGGPSQSPASSPGTGTQAEQPRPDDVGDDVASNPWEEVRFLDPEAGEKGSTDSSISEWELDFCSRPILDERGKKVWELVVCDGTLSLQYTRFFPNNVINSVTLRDAIASIADTLGVPLPQKIRFFRSQMQTIITKACSELGVKPVPSKRCISLLLWLEERYQTVYTRHPGFQRGSKPLLALDNPFPMELPENLFGERWAFVQLPFSGN